eukprot:COSAG05_NODE_1010_length_6207_cov_3.771447_5_plen_105_part_00
MDFVFSNSVCLCTQSTSSEEDELLSTDDDGDEEDDDDRPLSAGMKRKSGGSGLKQGNASKRARGSNSRPAQRTRKLVKTSSAEVPPPPPETSKVSSGDCASAID